MTISKLLIVVVLVAAGLSILINGFFSGYAGGLLPTLLVAIAGALVLTLLVVMVKSLPNTKVLHAIVSAVIGTLLFFFILSLTLDREDCNPSITAEITKCKGKKVTYRPKHIEVCKNGTVNWDSSKLLNGTKIEIHKFEKWTWFGIIRKPDQPLNQTNYTAIAPNPIGATAIKEGHFHYAITCTPPGEAAIIEDPMIDVPKKR